MTSPHLSHPDSKVHGANMGSIWGQQGPGGPYVGPMNLAIWVQLVFNTRNASANVSKYMQWKVSCDDYTETLKGHRVVWKIEIYYLIRMT